MDGRLPELAFHNHLLLERLRACLARSFRSLRSWCFLCRDTGRSENSSSMGGRPPANLLRFSAAHAGHISLTCGCLRQVGCFIAPPEPAKQESLINTNYNNCRCLSTKKSGLQRNYDGRGHRPSDRVRWCLAQFLLRNLVLHTIQAENPL